MATYKVIQDIEAEDKLLGPLTLRQFIYAIIVFVSGFIAFKLAFVAWWLVIPFLPHMILFSVLAAPFGHDHRHHHRRRIHRVALSGRFLQKFLR